MGTHSDDYFGQGDERRADSDAQGSRPKTGSRGKVTSRPSRESILQSYAAQDAERARNARMYSQAVSQVYQESASRANDRAAQRAELEARRREFEAAQAAARRASGQQPAQQSGASADRSRQPRPRTRVVPPLSSQESYDRTRSSMENYERARASRDALSETRRTRTPNREVIDGRGSIDSRAFNETHELVGYSIDDRDRPKAAVDASFSKTRWHSRAGQGFSDVPDSGAARHAPARPQRRSEVGFSGGVMSGRANYTAPKTGLAGVPLFVKIAVPIIVVLIAVIIYLVFFSG